MQPRVLTIATVILLAFGHRVGAQLQPGTVKWVFHTDGPITSTPAFSPDGVTIYVGTTIGLYAITNAGSNKWTFPAPQRERCSPAVASDGTIYHGDDQANVYAINPNGTKKWMYALQADFLYDTHYWTSPAIGGDGSVYLVANNGATVLYAFNALGGKKWVLSLESLVGLGTCSSAMSSDGSIYVGSPVGGRKLYAINPDGTTKWTVSLPTATEDSCAIAADGTIYISAGSLYAFTPNGTNKWVVGSGFDYGPSPVIGQDGTIYLGGASGPPVLSLYAYNPNGTLKWNAFPSSYGRGSNYNSTAAIDAGGIIYYCSQNTLFAVTPAGQYQWTFISPEGQSDNAPTTLSSPAIGPDGTIYAAFGSSLYALAGTNALAPSAWPMNRQNLRHTGKVEKPTLSPPKKRADANFDFQLSGEVGQPYTVQGTSDFLNWTSITSLVVTTLPMPVSDLTATNSLARFYRASSP